MFAFETHITVKVYESNCNLINCFNIVCCKLLLDMDVNGTIIIIIIIIINLPLIFHVV